MNCLKKIKKEKNKEELMQKIEITLAEHTHLLITEKWIETICRSFYEHCRLDCFGEELEMEIAAKDEIVKLIKFYNPEVYHAIVQCKQMEKETSESRIEMTEAAF